MVISTGMTLPRMDSVWALYALQNSMMFTPCGPRAVPTGGAGVAAPAWSCTLTSAAIFFFGGMLLLFLSRGHDEEYVVRLCHRAAARGQPNHCAAIPAEPEIAVGRARGASDLLDLAEAELDRGLAAEDLDERLDPLGLRVDLGDRGVQRGERAVDHHDRVGHVEVGDLDRLLRGAATGPGRGTGSDCLRLRAGDDGGGEHVLDLGHRQRDRLVAVADE